MLQVATFADPPRGGRMLLQGPLGDILDSLAAGELDSPAGNSAALCGAFAAALTAAIARKMPAAVAEGAAAQADTLRARLCRLAEGTGAAHHRALRLLEWAEAGPPHDEESALRNKELASALGEAADYPLRICEAAAEVAKLAGWVASRGPEATRADAFAAASIADAAAASAAALVETNLTVQPSDDRARSARRYAEAARAVRRSLEAS